MSSPVWPMLAAGRSAFAAYLPTLTDADWGRQSPCPGWSVHGQVAHIVAGAKTTPLTFGPSMAISGFSFDKLAARGRPPAGWRLAGRADRGAARVYWRPGTAGGTWRSALC
jgi:uncharacterized protein (TIGR03083 family)